MISIPTYERACDRDAARAVGRPSIVASAILSLARASGTHHAPAAAVLAAGCSVSDRVESLFQQRGSGETAARKIVIFLLVASTMATAACLLFAEALHHTIETILG